LVFGLPPWALAFFAGTALITINFWFLAKGLQNTAQLRKGSVAVSLVVRFYGRMLLTGLALFGLIVWAGLPVAALLAGMTTVVINILCWGIFRFNRQRQNVKEA
jgi:Flp pilus assembly protein TadB